jgi:hypothetical protein
VPCPLDARAACPRRFRRLLSAVAPASQPSVCVCYRTIERSASDGSNGSALRRRVSGGQPRDSLQLLWPRLTSAAPSVRLAAALAQRQGGRSLRVRRVTFLPYIRRIYADPVRMTSGFESMRPLARQIVASYAVGVPRTGSLPSASFRFRLAADTLAVRLGVPVIKASARTFTRLVKYPARFRLPVTASGHDAARHA